MIAKVQILHDNGEPVVELVALVDGSGVSRWRTPIPFVDNGLKVWGFDLVMHTMLASDPTTHSSPSQTAPSGQKA